MEIDLEDYLEEVKFQMSGHIELEEETIRKWEKRAREWVNKNQDKKRNIYKKGEEIIVTIKEEEDMERTAERFLRAYQKKRLEEYWRKFQIPD